MDFSELIYTCMTSGAVLSVPISLELFATPVTTSCAAINAVRSLLSHHLDALPDKYRSVLYLVDLLDLNYAEASLVLNIPLGTVKSRLARGRLLLSGSLQSSKELIPQSIFQHSM
jgi:DNA-directed RNA polymerase specialized sigma24 family protein